MNDGTIGYWHSQLIFEKNFYASFLTGLPVFPREHLCNIVLHTVKITFNNPLQVSTRRKTKRRTLPATARETKTRIGRANMERGRFKAPRRV